jgi:hypothetical protein
MSDLEWFAIAIALLLIVGLIFLWLWHGGEKPNGLKGELEARVTDLENDRVSIWAELQRQARLLANRWIP